MACAGAERGVHVIDVDRWSVIKRWPGAMKFDITQLAVSRASPDHCYVAGLDYELLCGCWARGALAGGFAFRGDSRWLGVGAASGGRGRDIVMAGGAGTSSRRAWRTPRGEQEAGEKKRRISMAMYFKVDPSYRVPQRSPRSFRVHSRCGLSFVASRVARVRPLD